MISLGERLKNHVSLYSNRDIKELCSQFFKDKSLKINHLNYIKKFNDGTVFYLCSNHDWLLHYYKQGYASIGAFEHNDQLSHFKYVLWNSLDTSDKILADSRDILGIQHGITIIDKTFDGCGFFNFGTTRQTTYINNEYISYIDTLREFIAFFKEKSKSILQEAEHSKFILPKEINQELLLYKRAENLTIPKKEKGLYLDDMFFNTHITPRELECLNLCITGLTVKKIADKLNISVRTAQTHIDNVKSKLGCQNMFQLGYTLAKIKQKISGYIP